MLTRMILISVLLISDSMISILSLVRDLGSMCNFSEVKNHFSDQSRADNS